MGKRSKLNDDQKVEVVLALLRQEEPASVLARRYGISDPTLYRWRDEFLQGGKAALASGKEEAERLHGPLTRRPFLVTDNGPSFIAKRFAEHVGDSYAHVRIQYRTPTQLGLLERFHQTLKNEEVYWRLYDNPAHARQCIAEFRERYNHRRPHWALVPPEGGDPVTPVDVYVHGLAVKLPKWQPWARAARAKLEQMMETEAA